MRVEGCGLRVEQLSNVSNEQAPNCIRFRVQGLGFRVQGFIEAKKRTLLILYMQQGFTGGGHVQTVRNHWRDNLINGGYQPPFANPPSQGFLSSRPPLFDGCVLGS